MNVFYSLIILSLFSCDFEEQWKSGQFVGSVSVIDKDVSIKLDLETNTFQFPDRDQSFTIKKNQETLSSVYYTVENAKDFNLPTYFKIQKESLVFYRIQMYPKNINGQMIAGDLKQIF